MRRSVFGASVKIAAFVASDSIMVCHTRRG